MDDASLNELKKILTDPTPPEEMGEDFKNKLADVFTTLLPAPEEVRRDWGRMIVDIVTPCGVWNRKALSKRDKSIATISALTAFNMTNELKVHIGRALDNGVTRQEIGEIFMHLAIYSGFPRSVEAMHCATEVFALRDRAEDDTGKQS